MYGILFRHNSFLDRHGMILSGIVWHGNFLNDFDLTENFGAIQLSYMGKNFGPPPQTTRKNFLNFKILFFSVLCW